MTDRPLLLGAPYSVYVRIARLVLLEKSVAFDTSEVDIFAAGGPPAEYRRLHPFDRIPALRHGTFALYETSAITRYVDEAFAGTSLQPGEAQARARMNQLISIADNYLYRPFVWGMYVAKDESIKQGIPLDRPAFDEAMTKTRHCLTVLADLYGDGPWVVGETLSLADLHLAPMIAYGCVTEEGRSLLREQPRLMDWWARINARASMVETRFTAEGRDQA